MHLTQAVFHNTWSKIQNHCHYLERAEIDSVLLLHDNAPPHTSIRTMETVASFGWTTLSFPPYSQDLAPSNYHLFSPMKEGLRGKHYTYDKEVKTAVMKWLKEQSTEFYEARVQAFI